MFIYDCKIRSSSGRGAVCIKGELILDNSTVTDCAATGVYVGGKASRASLSNCDISHNGLGGPTLNRDPGETVFAGHSGLYVEQGCVAVSHCNISKNTFTGISSCSPSNSTLVVTHSSIIANEGGGIELPPVESVSGLRSTVQETTIVEAQDAEHHKSPTIERIKEGIARGRAIGAGHEMDAEWFNDMLRGGKSAPFRNS